MIISLFLERQTGKIPWIFAYCTIFSSSAPCFNLLSQLISTLYFPIKHSREDPEYSKIHTGSYYKSRGQCQTKSNLDCNIMILPRRQDFLCNCFFSSLFLQVQRNFVCYKSPDMFHSRSGCNNCKCLPVIYVAKYFWGYKIKSVIMTPFPHCYQNQRSLHLQQ